MPVIGSSDGIIACNDRAVKVEPLVTPKILKDVYLTGLDITNPITGKPLPNSTYNKYIDNAVGLLETYLDISISEVSNFIEDKDYRVNDYSQWGYFMLNNIPVIQVNSIKLTYFRSDEGVPEVVQDIPLSWIRVNQHDGIVRLIPNARFPANLQISQTGNYFPEILRAEFVPHLWQITYSFGFREGKIPIFVNAVIARLAALQALVVGGNLVLGAGIASSHISMDGLSQSIQTTQSPENSAFSATIKEYQGWLFGRSKEDRFAELTILKDYYKGTSINII